LIILIQIGEIWQWTKDIARGVVDTLRGLELCVIQAEDILAAIDIHRLHKLSFWDCLIVRAAQRCGCRVLYSEDFQDGRNFDGTRVVNPFV
jgi:predicted nucleic acid-binding protein